MDFETTAERGEFTNASFDRLDVCIFEASKTGNAYVSLAVTTGLSSLHGFYMIIGWRLYIVGISRDVEFGWYNA
jgi:hypothetical protein